MYEDYMQNLLEEDYYPYQYTYEPISRDVNCFSEVEDYMQYPYNNNNCCNYGFPYNYNKNSYSRNLVADLENLYPEIYKIVYPMIQKACMQNNKPITEDVLEEMTNDIYSNIEADNIVNLNINIENRAENGSTNCIENKNESRFHNMQKKSSSESKENREYRQDNNPIRDLIRILLIRELLGRRTVQRPLRPFPPGPGPFSPNPPRPPIPNNPPWSPRTRF